MIAITANAIGKRPRAISGIAYGSKTASLTTLEYDRLGAIMSPYNV
jgi:hypothetical protein